MGRPTSRWRSKSWRLGITPPGSRATTPLRASCKGTSRARSSSTSETRDGTGRPPSPLWVGDELDANPMAPAAMDSATTACMRANSSGVAGRS